MNPRGIWVLVHCSASSFGSFIEKSRALNDDVQYLVGTPLIRIKDKKETHQRSHRYADGKGKRMSWIAHIGEGKGKELREELDDIEKIRINAYRWCSLPRGAVLQLTCGCVHSHAQSRYPNSKPCVSPFIVCLRKGSILSGCQGELYRKESQKTSMLQPSTNTR